MSFWDSLDQEGFSNELRTRLERELSEGFASLVKHLQPREKVKYSVDRLERRAREAVGSQLEILKRMCMDGVFQEPSQASRRRPVSFKVQESDLDRDLDALVLRLARAQGEIRSLDNRAAVLEGTAKRLAVSLGKVRHAADDIDFKSLKDTTQKSKRLRLVVASTKELRAKLPNADSSREQLEATLAQERKGMPSTRDLCMLDSKLAMSKEDELVD